MEFDDLQADTLAEAAGPRKRCPRCRVTKPHAAFARHRTSKDGLQSWCRICARAYRAERRLQLGASKVLDDGYSRIPFGINKDLQLRLNKVLRVKGITRNAYLRNVLEAAVSHDYSMMQEAVNEEALYETDDTLVLGAEILQTIAPTDPAATWVPDLLPEEADPLSYWRPQGQDALDPLSGQSVPDDIRQHGIVEDNDEPRHEE